MPASNERKMLSSNEALKELGIYVVFCDILIISKCVSLIECKNHSIVVILPANSLIKYKLLVYYCECSRT